MSNWTEREKIIAKQLVEPETLAFLNKIFVNTKTNANSVYEGKIVDLDDAQYGRLMKVLYLTNEENKARINLIHKISKQEKVKNDNPKMLAPR